MQVWPKFLLQPKAATPKQGAAATASPPPKAAEAGPPPASQQTPKNQEGCLTQAHADAFANLEGELPVVKNALNLAKLWKEKGPHRCNRYGRAGPIPVFVDG